MSLQSNVLSDQPKLTLDSNARSIKELLGRRLPMTAILLEHSEVFHARSIFDTTRSAVSRMTAGWRDSMDSGYLMACIL